METECQHVQIDVPRVINTTPHAVSVLIGAYDPSKPEFEKVTFPAEKGFEVRLTTVAGEPREALQGAPVFARPTYTVTHEGLGDGFKTIERINDTTIIVSTMVADRAPELRALMNAPGLRILVPDSGPDSIRANGQIVAVRRFFQY